MKALLRRQGLINGLLSRAGQAQVQKGRKDQPGTDSNAPRTAIPKNDVPEENQWRDGVEYFYGDDEHFSDRRSADKLVDEIFGKPGK